MVTFREKLLHQRKHDLDRPLPAAYRLGDTTDSRSVEQRRLRRRADAGGSRRWSSALTLLHLRARRAS